MDGSNNDVGLDDANAGDSENKVDLGDVDNGGGECCSGGGVDDAMLMLMVLN